MKKLCEECGKNEVELEFAPGDAQSEFKSGRQCPDCMVICCKDCYADKHADGKCPNRATKPEMGPEAKLCEVCGRFWVRFDLPAIQRLGDGRCPQCGTVCCFCCMANHRLAHPEPAREITDHRSEHTRRIGKFTVSPQVIFDMPEALRRMFGHMIVIRCEQLFHKHGFEYIAICDAFEVIDIGEEPRLYEPTFDGTTWTFPRVDLLGRRIGNTKVDQCL